MSYLSGIRPKARSTDVEVSGSGVGAGPAIQLRPGSSAGTNWIHFDVFLYALKFLLIPDPVVVGFSLPERFPSAVQQAVCFPRGVTLHGLQKARRGHIWRDEYVNVIAHDDPGMQIVAPARYTVLGWIVSDIIATARQLEEAGVRLERFEGMKNQNEQGIWTSPSNARVAWFKDPDGNTLSITQF